MLSIFNHWVTYKPMPFSKNSPFPSPGKASAQDQTAEVTRHADQISSCKRARKCLHLGELALSRLTIQAAVAMWKTRRDGLKMPNFLEMLADWVSALSNTVRMAIATLLTNTRPAEITTIR
jgi:hypothetical protein